MNVPDATRGAEGQKSPPAIDVTAAEAIRTGSSRDGVTSAVPRLVAEERPPIGPPPKSSTKWISAAVVLALMVFGITFGLTYFGTSGKQLDTVFEKANAIEKLTLSFETKKQPPPPGGLDDELPPLDVEARKEGGADYWFVNNNTKPVLLGLKEMSCGRCVAGADVFVLPPGSTMAPGKEADLEKTATVTTLTTPGSDEHATVGPKQVGWVRLKWTGENKKDALSVTLWLNAKEIGPDLKLEAHVKWHDPVKIDQATLAFEPTSAAKLKTLPLICWSVTRNELDLTTELFGGRKGAADPVVIGKPEKLSAEEYKDIAAIRTRERPGTVRVAYRIPVTVRGETEDGKLIDAGSFRRRMELTVNGHNGGAMNVEVTGQILGDVQVLGLVSSRIDFTSFDAKKGSKTEIVTLQTAKAMEELEVDDRTAQFLEVELKAPMNGTRQMLVRVKPGAAIGRFPRESPASYNDCAVYIRPKGMPNARLTRIAVEGSAIE
jgi:hypothetical protein